MSSPSNAESGGSTTTATRSSWHPAFFARPFRECWPERYAVIAPWMQRVREGGVVHVTDELARRLRSELEQVILVAVTGYGRATDRALSEQAGFEAHLVKPVDAVRLDALVRSLISEASDAPPR